jgi:hypothetical protein
MKNKNISIWMKNLIKGYVLKFNTVQNNITDTIKKYNDILENCLIT